MGIIRKCPPMSIRICPLSENNIMFDRQAIYARFAACHEADSAVTLANKLGLNRKTVYQWESGERQVPWNRLKMLVYEQKLSWDWILEGKDGKLPSSKRIHDTPFDRRGINRRFLSLFPHLTQNDLASLLGVSQAVVSYWHSGLNQVPWKRLHDAVEGGKATWDWLLEG